MMPSSEQALATTNLDSSAIVSSIAHFDGHFREANEGGQVDLILDRPVPHEDAVVLAPSMTKPAVVLPRHH
jgi:hypothetical protein